jgi:hypothetical protein
VGGNTDIVFSHGSVNLEGMPWMVVSHAGNRLTARGFTRGKETERYRIITVKIGIRNGCCYGGKGIFGYRMEKGTQRDFVQG